MTGENLIDEEKTVSTVRSLTILVKELAGQNLVRSDEIEALKLRVATLEERLSDGSNNAS